MKFDCLHHIAIIVSDYEVSKHFYTELLKFSILKETYRADRNSYKLDLAINDETQIELFSFPDPPKRLSYPEATGLRHLAFQVKNLEDVRRELLEKGLETEQIRIDELTQKHFFFFHDPDGLPIEVYEK